MKRPTPIAALDAALNESLARLDAAEAEVARVTLKHIAAIDELNAVRSERANAHHDALFCEDAIRTLGYAVLDPTQGTVAKGASLLDGRSYSTQKDEQEARNTP